MNTTTAPDQTTEAAARWTARLAVDPNAKPATAQERADKAAAYWQCKCGRKSFFHYRFDHR